MKLDVSNIVSLYDLSEHIKSHKWAIFSTSIDFSRLETLMLVNELLDLHCLFSLWELSRNDIKKSFRRAIKIVRSNSLYLEELKEIYSLLLDSKAREIIWARIKELEVMNSQLIVQGDLDGVHIESESEWQSLWLHNLSVWNNVVLYSDKKYKAVVIAVSKTIIVCNYTDDKWVSRNLSFDKQTWEHLLSPSCAYISTKKTPN